jgi:mRNA-degrading endonuclease toxin of MazEF toxin-antitoxin module
VDARKSILMPLLPGEIYFADANGGRRPVVIMSREELNHGKYVVAVPLTSTHFEIRSQMRHCVPFRSGEFGLPKDCVAQGEAITFIEIADLDLDAGLLGKVNDEKMRDLIRAIGFVISSECEPE